ncbi:MULTISPECIES: KAP family P-loop NTPase fold protein [Flavobacteriaceae]|uniref:KAP family P-loop NTPase fold protein n=1 Tax=Flavobacteriaceae TaxID=49546 RepID=UPI00234A9096|nr:P-loop NTPase fold protein [Muricauda sp. SP22]MDC6361646.1 P-loop NTPase fold protein [Muricauda sp. SP22]
MATLTINTAAKNYKVVLGDSPNNYDLAIVSIDSQGNSGELNDYVLEKYGYEFLGVSEESLKKGFHFLRTPDKKPILFVVTVGESNTSENLIRNLTNALFETSKFLTSKDIWIPLMGTGTGGLDFLSSYNAIIGVIQQFHDLFFTVAIPRDERGKTFVEENNIEVSDPLKNLLPDINYYLGGHLWGADNDQMDRFVSNGIWENGHDSKDIEIVNSAKIGDIVLLKSTFQQGGTSYLRLKGIGFVLKNHADGHNLEMNWHIFDNYVDIQNLGKYRNTFTRLSAEDVELVLNRLKEEVPNFYLVIDVLSAQPANMDIESNESEMDENATMFYGQEVGQEIRDYDIIFLPKSSYGGVGNNSIATHVLDLLGIDKNVLLFSEENLIENRYSLNDIEANGKVYFIAFIVTRDELKESLPFEKHFFIAIENFRKSQYFIRLKEEGKHLKIFVPFLGTGQAGMTVYDSYKNLIPGIKRIKSLDIPKTIRINYPRESDIFEITKFNARFLIQLHLRPYKSESAGASTIDKIPFHLDQVVDEDELGREPVAKAFVNLIKKDIFTDKLNYSFMVHLQGEWGAGKSSFLNFIKKHLCLHGEKWIIVDYNAWQNQHIDPPWWTMIDHIYRKSKPQLDRRARFQLWRKETIRRIWRYTGWEKVTILLVFLVCILCITYFGEGIISFFNGIKESEKGIMTNVESFGKLIITACSIVGVLYTFSKFITIPFFINSSKEAKSFVLRASDPMNKIKKHFNDLVDDINSKKQKQQLAIFIDDIDRCDKEFIVNLLEGIQTLFKEKRVLYIVAGDKNWITTSFGKVYKDFVSPETTEQRLGEFFLEKAFQLSFRMPNISEEAKKNYWNTILGIGNDQGEAKIEHVDQLSETKQREIKNKLSNSKSELTSPEFMKQMEVDYNLSEDTVSDIIIEEKNKDTTEIRHLLNDFHEVIDTNPRSIIRLANNYTMIRSTLIAERRKIDEQKIFRWLVIEDLMPEISNNFVNLTDVSLIEERLKEIKDPTKRKNCLRLLLGANSNNEDAMTIEEIKQIKGL